MSEMKKKLPISRKILVFYCEHALKGKRLALHKEKFSEVGFVAFPCTGRINPVMSFKALMDGAGGVIIYGCPLGDCHNFDGNMFANRRFFAAKTTAEALGVDPERISYVQRDPLDYGILTREITAMKRVLDEMGVGA